MSDVRQTAEKITILYVDDEPDLGELVATYLEQENDQFNTETASDATSALTRLADTTFDCIISDYDMPGQNGIEFLESVREDYPDIPFILYTGKGSEEVASDAISAGATDYLQKGRGTDQYTVLANRVQNVVEKYRSQRVANERPWMYGDISAKPGAKSCFQALSKMSQEFLTANDKKEIVEAGVNATRDLLDLDKNGIHLYDDDEEGLVPIAWTKPAEELIGEPPTLKKEDSIAWRVYKSGEPLAVDDVHDDPDIRNPDSPVKSELYIPIDGHGILINASETGKVFSERDIMLGELLADNIAAALNLMDQTTKLRARKKTLKRQNERLDEFTSVVSHDLRNPLSIAQGNIGLLRGEYDDDRIETVDNALTRMGDLIEDLLMLAREGKEVNSTEPTTIKEVATNCWENVETANAELSVRTDRTIQADRCRIAQLFENLIRNAIEHVGQTVSITIGEFKNGFYIEDDGPGIPNDERDTVFEAGYSTQTGGTGFGLSIVKQVAEAHGWEISVTEGTDGGARFEVSDVMFVNE